MRTRSGLAAVPSSRLVAEIDRRQARAADLARERDRLLKRVRTLEARIASEDLGPASGLVLRARAGRGRPRGATGQGLHAVLAKVLKGKRMTTAEAASAARAAGYRTSAKSYVRMVRNALAKHKALFVRDGRGIYTAR